MHALCACIQSAGRADRRRITIYILVSVSVQVLSGAVDFYRSNYSVKNTTLNFGSAAVVVSVGLYARSSLDVCVSCIRDTTEVK